LSDHKHAEVEEIVSVSQSVRGVADFAESAAAYSDDADPDISIWGAVGLAFAQVYALSSEHIHAVLQRLPDGLNGLAQRIEDAAQSIADNDDQVKRSFDELNSAETESNEADG
jgi:methyl-accepting chemotaxis protein